MRVSRDPADVALALEQIQGKKPSKYRSIRTTVDGVRFDSQREAARFSELRILVRTGAIRDLELQPQFPIVVRGRRIGLYVADFRYVDLVTGEVVIEDVKSEATETRLYHWKKKLVEALYPIQIREV